MKAVVLRNGKLNTETVPEPTPAAGQLLTRPLACGVCGSDLHIREHATHVCDLLHRAGFRGFMDPAQPVVLGHEFCCEVLDWGPETPRRLSKGQRVVSQPFIDGPQGVELIGYSNRFNGAFSEQMLLAEQVAIPVPDHVPTEIAALTEPLSVAVHAVAQSGPGPADAFCVVGCGPVGLFVIARLRALGLGPVMAIEPNPARRRLAETLGADMVALPDGDAGEAWWDGLGLPRGLSDSMAVDPMLRKRERAVIFECVGKPGMLMQVARAAPVGATIVVVGTCMEHDTVEPAFLLQKGLNLRFVFAYTPDEFTEAFAMICADPEALRPFVTKRVDFARAGQAFDALGAGGEDVKVLVSPP